MTNLAFSKYEAAGNSYTVLHNDEIELSAIDVIRFCHSSFGIGGDGILTWNRSGEIVDVKIFNPDGSLAEKSGNGLRILASYLFNHKFQEEKHLTFNTAGDKVIATRENLTNDCQILLEMGVVLSQIDGKKLSDSTKFKAGVRLETAAATIFGYPVSIGNPHFVIFDDELSAENTQRLGPLVENHPYFPNRTNVQFAQVKSDGEIIAEIWERGAGYTLSSGSSSCAIAAVAHQLGKCQRQVDVKMAGGTLTVKMEPDGTIYLTGPVKKTAEGTLFV